MHLRPFVMQEHPDTFDTIAFLSISILLNPRDQTHTINKSATFSQCDTTHTFEPITTHHILRTHCLHSTTTKCAQSATSNVSNAFNTSYIPDHTGLSLIDIDMAAELSIAGFAPSTSVSEVLCADAL